MWNLLNFDTSGMYELSVQWCILKCIAPAPHTVLQEVLTFISTIYYYLFNDPDAIEMYYCYVQYMSCFSLF